MDHNGKKSTQAQLKKFVKHVMVEDGEAFIATFHVLRDGMVDHVVEISEGFRTADFGGVITALTKAWAKNEQQGISARDRM